MKTKDKEEIIESFESNEERYKKISSKYNFYSFGEFSEGFYKDWKIKFLLLTEKEFNLLVRKTYKRMKEQNKELKKISYAGYSNRYGKDI